MHGINADNPALAKGGHDTHLTIKLVVFLVNCSLVNWQAPTENLTLLRSFCKALV
jgi:hypothetical protein